MEPKFDLPITSSPVPSSSFSQLTSVSSGQAEDLDRRCRERFEKYVPINAQDDVVRLLTAFMDHLPKDGSVRLMQDIIALDGDSKLRQLRNHLVDALLKPSEYIDLLFKGEPHLFRLTLFQSKHQVEKPLLPPHLPVATIKRKILNLLSY